MKPLKNDEWPAESLQFRDGFAGALNVYRTMAIHPGLLNAWAPLRQHLVKETTLGPERAEVVILRTGFRLGSEYEWVHHVSRARALGFSDARISAIRDMPDGEDGLLVRAVDAVFDAHQLSHALQEELVAAIGKQAMLDLIATVGFYCVLGSILKSFDVPIDSDVLAEIEARPLVD